LIETAELDARATHSFVVRQAVSEMTSHEPLQMEAEFIIQVLLDDAASGERAKSVNEIREHR
jgi:hypothetical protein